MITSFLDGDQAGVEGLSRRKCVGFRVDSLLLEVVCVVLGAAFGILVALARLRPRLLAARREAERSRREHAAMAGGLAVAEGAAPRAADPAVAGIEEPAREAHRALRGRGDVQVAIAKGIEDLERALGVGVGRGASVTAVTHDFDGSARRTEQAIGEQEARLRSIAVEAEAALAAAQAAGAAA